MGKVILKHPLLASDLSRRVKVLHHTAAADAKVFTPWFHAL
jgi:hypothetical protein